MGFMDKMKAANGMNLGEINSPDFPCGVLVMKDKQLTIINGALNGENYERVVKQSDIKVFKLIGCGGMWAKYLLVFKDGKQGIITQEVLTQTQRKQAGTSITMVPIETYIHYVDDTPVAPIVASPSPEKVELLNQKVEQPGVEKKPKKEEIIEQIKEERPLVCPKCGSPIDEEMVFCGECGAKLK